MGIPSFRAKQKSGQKSSQNPQASKNSGKKAGRWTVTEHQVFLEGLKRHGKDWKLISHMIPSRSVVQIRTHAQKYYQKLAKMTGGPVKSTSKKEDTIKPTAATARSVRSARFARSTTPPKAPKSKSKRKDASSGRKKSTSPTKKNKKPPRIKTKIAATILGVRGPDSKSSLSSMSTSSEGGTGTIGVTGGATPRTVAAATILIKPRVENRIELGSGTPRTLEAAQWLHAQMESVRGVLGDGDKDDSARGSMSEADTF